MFLGRYRNTIYFKKIILASVFFSVFFFFWLPLAYAAQQRIISLAPNLTEILFVIGAGKEIVGTSSYSNFPSAAKKIPIVDNAGMLNVEAIIQLKPTIVVAWKGGNPKNQLDELRSFHIPVYSFTFKNIKSIPKAMQALGQLTKHQTEANEKAKVFMEKLKNIEPKKKSNKKVFYILWQNPLITIGKATLINQAINFCGGRNIFADIHLSAPQVSMSSVIKRNPEIIISGVNEHTLFKYWRKWKIIQAVKNKQLYFINPNLLQRPGPRFIKGLSELCKLMS